MTTWWIKRRAISGIFCYYSVQKLNTSAFQSTEDHRTQNSNFASCFCGCGVCSVI